MREKKMGPAVAWTWRAAAGGGERIRIIFLWFLNLFFSKLPLLCVV